MFGMQHIGISCKGKGHCGRMFWWFYWVTRLAVNLCYNGASFWNGWVHMTTTEQIEELIGQMALGNRKAFDDLYSATSAKLFGVCLRVLGQRAEAEDALQDVYVKVWRNAERYQVNGLSPMTWLITIARNTAIDCLRRRKNADAELVEAEAQADSAPGPEAHAIAASEGVRIAGCMAQLEPDRADAVRRAYLEGETYEELAGHFGIPLNTVRTWLRRSLLKLRECLSS